MHDGLYPGTRSSASEAAALMVQIDRPGGESPLKFSAVVRNLVTGVVTLEVNNPWTILDWETLEGQGGCLSLLAAGTGKVTEIRGTVAWARYTVQDRDRSQLSLGLQLSGPDSSAQKLLFERIPNTSADIKGLWERWDQARQTPEPAALNTKIALIAACLLMGSIAVQLAGPKGFKPFGWVLWIFGTMAVAYQVLRFWKSRKASR